MSSSSTSLTIIFFFIILMILGTIPECHNAARILEDFYPNGVYPPPPTPGVGTDINSPGGGVPSKGGVHRNNSSDAGSATGNDSPTGSVQVPPSNTKTNLSYEHSNTSTPSGSSSQSRKSFVSTTNNSTSTPNSHSTYKSVHNTTVTQHNTSSHVEVGNTGNLPNGFNVPPGVPVNVPSSFPPAPPFPMQP